MSGRRRRGVPDPGATLAKALAKAVAKNKGYGGGIYCIATERGIVWEGASGYADASHARAIEAADTFEIASITKTFTATVILQLAQAGRLGLDTALGAVLPPLLTRDLLVVGGHDYGAELTIRQLLAQTSGLPDYWYDPPHVAPDTNAFLRDFEASASRLWHGREIISYVPGLTPIAKPGSTWHYADTNFVLLALVIEAVDGVPLQVAFRRRLFQPLGMVDTYLSYREAPTSTRPEAHGFESDLSLHGREHQSSDWGGGGLVSSTRDLTRFLFALTGGRILHAETLAAMQTFGPTDQDSILYGLGIYGIPLDDGAGMLWGHDGHGNSFMYFWPQRGLAFTGTLNQTDADWWPLVATALDVLPRG